MTAWHAGRFVGYDFESTSPDPLDARIVTAAIVHMERNTHHRPIQWLLDPGTDIPPEAAEIHGWTREQILDKVGGEDRAIRSTPNPVGTGWNRMQMTVEGALGEISGHLALAMHTDIPGVPVVAANASYDFTLLETELDRHDLPTLTSRPGGIRGVVDPMVIDKAFDPYRKVNRDGGCQGGRYGCGGCGATDKKLGSLCQHYGIPLEHAHDAAADAVAAVMLAARFADLWPELGRWRLPTLYDHQIAWRREQADSLRAHFDRQGTEHDGVDPGWPLHTQLTTLTPTLERT